MGRKFRGLGPHLRRSPLGWGLPPHQVASWCMQPFGHNRNGPKIGEGGSAPFLGRIERGLHLTQSRLGWGLDPYQVASWSMQPFVPNRYGPKIGWGLCPFGGAGAGSPSNTMWPGTRPTCVPSFVLIRSTVWPQCTNVTDRQTDRTGQTDRQTDRQTTVW